MPLPDEYYGAPRGFLDTLSDAFVGEPDPRTGERGFTVGGAGNFLSLLGAILPREIKGWYAGPRAAALGDLFRGFEEESRRGAALRGFSDIVRAQSPDGGGGPGPAPAPESGAMFQPIGFRPPLLSGMDPRALRFFSPRDPSGLWQMQTDIEKRLTEQEKQAAQAQLATEMFRRQDIAQPERLGRAAGVAGVMPPADILYRTPEELAQVKATATAQRLGAEQTAAILTQTDAMRVWAREQNLDPNDPKLYPLIWQAKAIQFPRADIAQALFQGNPMGLLDFYAEDSYRQAKRFKEQTGMQRVPRMTDEGRVVVDVKPAIRTPEEAKQAARAGIAALRALGSDPAYSPGLAEAALEMFRLAYDNPSEQTVDLALSFFQGLGRIQESQALYRAENLANQQATRVDARVGQNNARISSLERQQLQLKQAMQFVPASQYRTMKGVDLSLLDKYEAAEKEIAALKQENAILLGQRPGIKAPQPGPPPPHAPPPGPRAKYEEQLRRTDEYKGLRSDAERNAFLAKWLKKWDDLYGSP